jgi:hypothetical protein
MCRTKVALATLVVAATSSCADGAGTPGSGTIPLERPPSQMQTGLERAVASRGPIKRTVVGRGARAALVAYRGELSAVRPVVVFLHGWGLPIGAYGAWVDHLVRLGNTVIAPRYQRSAAADPAGVAAAAAAGLRAALRRVRVAPSTLVFAGHSAGGALAADLAVRATRGEFPRPVGVFSVYPGRAIRGYPAGIPPEPIARLRAPTRLLVLAGAADAVVGVAPAQRQIARATGLEPARRRLVTIGDRRVSDHLGPTRATSAARTAFWRRLDRFLRLSRGR